jgi:hypothetical protein
LHKYDLFPYNEISYKNPSSKNPSRPCILKTPSSNFKILFLRQVSKLDQLTLISLS